MFDFLDSVCKIKRDPTYNLIHLKMDPLQFLGEFANTYQKL